MNDHRPYSSTFSTFWTGATGRQLRDAPNAQRVAFYLFTAPGANMIGLYYLALPTLAHEVGLTVEGAREALGRLSAMGFAHYDPEAEMIWVVEMARYQLLETAKRRLEALPSADNRIGYLKRLYATLPTCAFLHPFYEKYAPALHLDTPRADGPAETRETPSRGAPQAPPKPLPSPSGDSDYDSDSDYTTPAAPSRRSGARRAPALPTTAGMVGEGASPEALMVAWNLEAPRLPKATRLREPRRRHCLARLHERPLAEWAALFRRMNTHPFLTGETSRNGWRPTFGWLIEKPANIDKVEEWLEAAGPPGPPEPGTPEWAATVPAWIEVAEGTPGAVEQDGAFVLEVDPADPRHPQHRGATS